MDIQQIVDGLSEAQREAVSHPENGDDFWWADGRTVKSVFSKGLCAQPNRHGSANWTPLGMQVRTHLLKESGNAG